MEFRRKKAPHETFASVQGPLTAPLSVFVSNIGLPALDVGWRFQFENRDNKLLTIEERVCDVKDDEDVFVVFISRVKLATIDLF